MGPSKHIGKKELLICCVIVLLTLAQNQVSGAVILRLDAENTTCSEGIEIVDQRVCPQQGFVCMTDTGALLWEPGISTAPPSVIYQTGNDLDAPATLLSVGVDGTELFVITLTADDTLGNLTSTLTIPDSYNAGTTTVTCSDGVGSGAGVNMDSHMLQVVTSVPSPPNVMYSIIATDCALPGTADITVSWQCPANTAGTIITGFSVSLNGAIRTNTSGTDSSDSITGLPLGQTHDIAVAASNCLGTGDSSSLQVFLPDVPFPPVNLAVVRSSCDQLTVTWQNDARNGDLPCLVTGIAFDYNINGGVGQSLPLSAIDVTQSIDIDDNIGTYDVTVSYINGLGNDGDTISLSDVSRARSEGFVDSNNTIQVRLDSICTGNFQVQVTYGLSSSGGLDMTSSCVGFVMGLAQVPLPNLVAQQRYNYTYTLYRGGVCDGAFLERSAVMMFTPLLGCSSEGLVTSDTVTITPNRTEYLNEEVVTYGCSGSDEINGPETRTCQNGVWNPPLTRETSCSSSDNTGAIVGGVVGGIGGVLLVLVIIVVVYLCYQKNKNKGSRKPSDVRELRERTRSDDGQPDVEIAAVGETAPMYADPSAIDRQEFPGTHDVYTVVDKTKKTHKPEDHQPTYQTPDDIKRQPAPATGEVYTIPEPKKGSKKKKEATPPQKSDEELQQMYSQVDMGKKHQPPSGLVYSDISLPPSGKPPASKSVNYTDIQPH